MVSKDMRFAYDNEWNLLAELNGQSNDALLNRYMWGLDMSGTLHGAGGIGGLLLTTLSGADYLPVCEENGNIKMLENAQGTLVCGYEYAPSGEPLRENGTDAIANPFGWNTKYTDRETGLVQYPLRTYQPATGRWLKRDPLEEEGGANLYAMVRNNPLSLVDPFGLRDLNSSETEVISKMESLANEVRAKTPELAKQLDAVVGDLQNTVAGIKHDERDPIGLRVAQAALRIWADKDQANAFLDDANSYKCNLYVAKVLKIAGANPSILDYPSKKKRRDPLAGEWFDTSEKQLARFKVIYQLRKKDKSSDGATLAEWNQSVSIQRPQLGDIVALGQDGLSVQPNGAHVGISLGGDLFISATIQNVPGSQSAVAIKFIVPTYTLYDKIIYRSVPGN